MNAASPPTLTELDYCILGAIWREGPISAYGVRRLFASSATVAWSSSTGSIYPAINRLRAAGLVKAAPATGPRKAELLSLSPKGRGPLRKWLITLSPELGLPAADMIRTRVQFLTALDRPARLQVLAGYRRATLDAIAKLEAGVRAPVTTDAEKAERLGGLGALGELRARLRWLRAIESELAALGEASSERVSDRCP